MVSEDRSHHLTRSGDLAGMGDGGREEAVSSVILRLSGTVRVHLAERLHEYLSTVVVFPTSIDHAAVVEQCRVGRMHLVETDLPHITPFAVAKIQVADFHCPAIHRATVAGGVEHDIFVRQVDGFYICKSQSGSDLF